MTAVLLLTLGQFVAAMLLVTAFLLIARQVAGDFYQSGALLLLVFVLTAFALIGAVWGAFVRPWWVYMFASSALAALTLFLTFALVDWLIAGTTAKLGPAGTVFLLPILVFIFTYPLVGVAQWLIGLAKR